MPAESTQFNAESDFSRLDVCIAEKLPDLTRSGVKKLIEEGRVELRGEKCVYLEVGQSYEEAGWTATSFRRDVSDKVVVTKNTVDTSREGIYEIIYILNDFRFSQARRVRYVVVGEPDDLARFEEWLVFKKKILYLDRTRFNYLLNVTCSDGKCKMAITQISYYYREDMNGENGDTYKAEEWISDKEAINKAGTKLYPISGKFRRKTVDRVESIFKQAREEFEKEIRKENQATELITE